MLTAWRRTIRAAIEMLFRSARSASVALASNWEWPHFSITELACRCGGRFCDASYWHDPHTLTGLESMRFKIGKPLIVNSAHRCALWNASVGGAPLSQHKRMAVDLSLRGHDRFTVLSAAKDAGFTGLGLARTFLHVDRRKAPAQWYYKGSKHLWMT